MYRNDNVFLYNDLGCPLSNSREREKKDSINWHEIHTNNTKTSNICKRFSIFGLFFIWISTIFRMTEAIDFFSLFYLKSVWHIEKSNDSLFYSICVSVFFFGKNYMMTCGFYNEDVPDVKQTASCVTETMITAEPFFEWNAKTKICLLRPGHLCASEWIGNCWIFMVLETWEISQFYDRTRKNGSPTFFGPHAP